MPALGPLGPWGVGGVLGRTCLGEHLLLRCGLRILCLGSLGGLHSVRVLSTSLETGRGCWVWNQSDESVQRFLPQVLMTPQPPLLTFMVYWHLDTQGFPGSGGTRGDL